MLHADRIEHPTLCGISPGESEARIIVHIDVSHDNATYRVARKTYLTQRRSGAQNPFLSYPGAGTTDTK